MDQDCWWKLLSLGENLNLPGRGQEEGDNIQARRPEKERLVRKYSSRVETAPRSRNTYRLEKWNASSEKLGVDSHNHWPHLEKGILCHGGGELLSSSIMLEACQHKAADAYSPRQLQKLPQILGLHRWRYPRCCAPIIGILVECLVWDYQTRWLE